MAGIMTALAGPLAGLVAPQNIHAGWIDANMIARTVSQPNTPVVVINLEGSKQSKSNPGGNAGGNDSMYASTGSTLNSDGSVTTLYEKVREDQSVRLAVQCNGLDGAHKRDSVVQAILTTFGQAIWLPLPDSMEGVPAANPWLSVVNDTEYNVRAYLNYVGKMPVDNNDQRQEYRYDVLYMATYAVLAVRTDPVITEVDTSIVTMF